MWNSPSSILWWTHWWLGLKRRVWPTMPTNPVSCCERQAGIGVAEVVRQRDLDLDVLARLRQASVCSACIGVGVARITASMSSIASAASSEPTARPTPCSRAKSSAVSSVELMIAATSTSSIRFSPLTCLAPKAPPPARAIFRGR
jgi:hypothetical protein